MQKGKIFFNIIIIMTVIAFISVIGYMAYYYISNYIALKEAEQAVDEFENKVMVVAIEEEETPKEGQTETLPTQETSTTNQSTTNKTSSTTKYKGYSMIGAIQIPKTKVKAPIVDKVTPNSIAAAVGTLYGPGLNQVGNTVLAAHNYRNRNFLF